MLKRMIGLGLAFGIALLAGSLIANAVAGTGEGGEGYNLGAFEIQYPYEDADRTSGGTYAGVAYATSWASARYPGESSCTIELTDEAGAIVGRTNFSLDSGEQFVPAEHFTPVAVSGEPSQANAECRAVDQPPAQGDQGYVFSDPKVGDSTDTEGAKVTFDVRREGSAPPGFRVCTFTVSLESGGTKTLTGGVYIGDPDVSSMDILPGVGRGEIDSVSVSCEPPSK